MKEHQVLHEIGAFLVIFFSFTWLFWLVFSAISGLYSVLSSCAISVKSYIQRKTLENPA